MDKTLDTPEKINNWLELALVIMQYDKNEPSLTKTAFLIKFIAEHCVLKTDINKIISNQEPRDLGYTQFIINDLKKLIGD